MNFQQRYKIASVATIVLCTAFSGASAADKNRGAADALAQCAGIAEDGARLACFDAAAAGAIEAIEIAVADTLSREQAFGAEELPGADKSDAADRIEAAVSTLSFDAGGMLTVKLENGQVWRQHYTERRIRPIDESLRYRAEIKRNFLGKYFMELTPSGRKLQVARSE